MTNLGVPICVNPFNTVTLLQHAKGIMTEHGSVVSKAANVITLCLLPSSFDVWKPESAVESVVEVEGWAIQTSSVLTLYSKSRHTLETT